MTLPDDEDDENKEIITTAPKKYTVDVTAEVPVPVGKVTIESSPRRHVILAIFFVSAAVNGLPFSHSFIADVFVTYYNIDYVMANMLPLLFMASFIVSFLPANWIFETRGLRFGVLIGVFTTAIGAWLFCASVDPNMFWMALVAQTVIGIGQPFLLNVPFYLASIWFPAGEVSRACAVASFGAPIGILSGAVLLPAVVNGRDSKTIYQQLLWYHIVYACISSVLLLLTLIVFKDQPKYAPSLARAELIRNPPEPSVKNSIRLLFKNRNYVMHLISFGLMNGVQNGFVSVMNEMVLGAHPDAKNKLWVLGLILCISGIVACLFFGLLLDVTHKYKETAFGLILCIAAAVAVWTGIVNLGMKVLFAVTFFMGFFIIGYLPVGLELGAELTYPVSEVTTASLLTMAGCIVGIILTFIGSWTLESYGNLPTNLTFLGVIIIAFVFSALTKSDLRRLEANKTSPSEIN